MKSKNQASFTLIELLVVIAIIALLSSVVLASLNSAREKGRISAGTSFEAQTYHAIADSATGIWDFDECSGTVAKDRSGFGYDAVLSNMSSTWPTDTPSGKGCSLSFDGVDDLVKVSNWPASSGGDTGSVSFWLSVPFVQTNHGFIGMYTNHPLFYMGGSGTIQMYDGYGVFASAGLISYQLWHHFVYTWDNNMATIYIDGKLISSAAFSTTFNRAMGDMYFGSYGGGGNKLVGSMDSIRIFSRTLTSSEVGVMYAFEVPKNKFAHNVR